MKILLLALSSLALARAAAAADLLCAPLADDGSTPRLAEKALVRGNSLTIVLAGAGGKSITGQLVSSAELDEGALELEARVAQASQVDATLISLRGSRILHIVPLGSRGVPEALECQ
jgi:hypothetical protein